jgi:hypothetical protein
MIIIGFIRRHRSTEMGLAEDEQVIETLSPRITEERLTKLLGEDNLVGSAGEFGLLFAFLAHSCRTKEMDGEPAVSLDDVRSMFVDKRLPDGWEAWKKSRVDWVVHTTGLLIVAHREYRRLESGS